LKEDEKKIYIKYENQMYRSNLLGDGVRQIMCKHFVAFLQIDFHKWQREKN
jgi:hypothetical protein